MDGNVGSIRRIPNLDSALVPIPSRPLHRFIAETSSCFNHVVSLPVLWPALSRRQHDVLLRPALSPRVHLLPPLRHPTSLQRPLLFPNQRAEVHRTDSQLARPPHGFRRPPGRPRRRRRHG